jgi:Raf kinase inhibitor-like YbhB/YbcL family protein
MAQRFSLADLRISSPAFGEHGRIPEVNTGDGRDLSPPLEWWGAPEGARSFALVVHDPDAPLVDGFTHWVLYGIPGSTTSLAEGSTSFVTGQNSFGNAGYNGPAPPPGHGLHHYFFWLYALDNAPDLATGLDRRALFELIEDHVLEQARVVGVYQR